MANGTEQNSFGGRIARYARVSTAMGGLAARLAGQRYLGLKLERGEHAKELRDALGGLKGPLMKVAQILSTIMPAGMLFVPSIGGISHHWTENTEDADIVTGAEVFVDACRRLLAG